MIRTALGGLAALTALFLVWDRLLRDAVPEALAPVARVSTLELEELRGYASESVALARSAARVVEERLETAAPFVESAPAPAAPNAAALPEPGDEHVPQLDPQPDEAIDAALIRRMLAVYARTASPE